MELELYTVHCTVYIVAVVEPLVLSVVGEVYPIVIAGVPGPSGKP